MIGRVSLSPGTRRWFAISYKWFQNEEAVSTVDFTVENTDPNASDYGAETFTITDQTIDTVNDRVAFLAGDGLPGNTYLLTATITTSLGQIQPECIEFNILEEC